MKRGRFGHTSGGLGEIPQSSIEILVEQASDRGIVDDYSSFDEPPHGNEYLAN
jgi:hypothetical protein